MQSGREAKVSKFWLCTGIAIILLLAIVFLFIPVARHYIREFYTGAFSIFELTPIQEAEMEEYFDEPITLPLEWQIVEPFPEDLVEAGKALQNESKRWEEAGRFLAPPEIPDSTFGGNALSVLVAGGTLTGEQWEQVDQLLLEASDLLEAASKFIGHPSYELEAFPPDVREHQGPDGKMRKYEIFDYTLEGQITRLTMLKSFHFGHRSQWRQSMDEMLLAFEAAKRVCEKPISWPNVGSLG